MQNLITSLLNRSRVERHEIKRVNLNLSQIANNIIQELCSREPERKTELNVKADVFAFADAHLIQLALENLLRNAWKFTSKKEITRIEFGYNLQNNKKVYFIKDNGAGFDMQFAQKIFQPFQRLHKEKEFSGTGIGLSIVYRVINRHNGKIWATGEKNKGATFFFTLD
jgi:light-regulated signal transduction histidine kinase (bacteriophytochrome)